MTPAITVDCLTKRFASSRARSSTDGHVLAVDDVSFTLNDGDTLGLVGESGAGKSTIARCVLGLAQPSSGSIQLFGRDTDQLSPKGWREVRRNLQAVFQDPRGAMNSRWTVAHTVGEPLRLLGDLRPEHIRDRVTESLVAVGLDPSLHDRYRHQLSGGQQQRVSIARAISIRPTAMVLDEPVASLDASVKRDVVELLADLQVRERLSYLIISHDLRVVRVLCSRLLVLYRGRVVETGPTTDIVRDPQHPYTRELLGAQLLLPGDTQPVPPASEGDAWITEDDGVSRAHEAEEIGPLVQVGPHHYIAEHRRVKK